MFKLLECIICIDLVVFERLLLCPEKALLTFALFYFVFFSSILKAEIDPVKFTADKIIITPDQVIEATGNVEIEQGDVKIQAQSMLIDQKTSEVYLTNIGEYFDGDSTKFSAENATLNSDLSQGIIKTAQILLDEAIKIEAEKIEIQNGQIRRVHNISRVTSCDDCKNGTPIWFFTASSAERDLEDQTLPIGMSNSKFLELL